MGEEAGVFTHQSPPITDWASLWDATALACHMWDKQAKVVSPVRWRNTGHQPRICSLTPITVSRPLLTEHLL